MSLLQEKVEGPLAKEVFLNGDDQSRAVVAERCARWLAHFHATAPRSGKVFDLNNYLVSIERWSRRIARRIDPLAHKASELCTWLEREVAVLRRVNVCAGQGSYNHRQIILAESRTVTSNWDGYCLADPSHDVARFIISLRQLSLGPVGPIPALDAATEIFQRTYFRLNSPEVIPNLTFYKAALCVQLAKYEIHQKFSHSRERVEALLNEGLRIIA